MKSVLVKTTVALLFAGLLVAGLFRDELPDIVANATMICYSCIGLK
jgi:hypothetical protein